MRSYYSFVSSPTPIPPPKRELIYSEKRPLGHLARCVPNPFFHELRVHSASQWIPGLVFVDLLRRPGPVFLDLLRSPVIDSQPGGPVRQPYLSNRPVWLHRLAESIPRNRFQDSINVYNYGLRYRFSAWRAGTKPNFSYWPARLHRLAKSIPRNRFLGSINVYKYGLCTVFRHPMGVGLGTE